MALAPDRAPASRTPDTHADHDAAGPVVESAAPAPDRSGLALLGRRVIRARGNGSVRQAALLAAQRTAGNRATRRFVQRAPMGSAVPVQRNGTGLAGSKVSGAFTAEAQAILDNWDHLKPRDRAWGLANAASAQLESLGAPRIAGDFGDTRQMGANSYGAFSPALWQITLNEAGFRDDCTAEQRARAAGVVYHEARHAEQYFRVARMLAGQAQPGANAASEGARIAKELGLREDVATVAARSPLSDPGKKKSRSKQEQQEREKEYAEAKTWKDAMDRYHGKGGVAETLKTAQARFNAARRGLAETPNDEAVKKEYREAYAATRGAYLIYQKQASVESDAWAVGGAVEAALGQTPNTAEEELAKMGADPRAEVNLVAGPNATLPRPTTSSAASPSGQGGQGRPHSANLGLPKGGFDPNEIAAQGPDQPGAQGPDLGTPPVPTGTPLDPGVPRVPHKRIFALPQGGLDPNAIAGQGPDRPGAIPDPGLPTVGGPVPVDPGVPRIPHKRIFALPQGGLDPNAIAGQGPDTGRRAGSRARLAARPHGGRPAARRAGTPGRRRPAPAAQPDLPPAHRRSRPERRRGRCAGPAPRAARGASPRRAGSRASIPAQPATPSAWTRGPGEPDENRLRRNGLLRRPDGCRAVRMTTSPPGKLPHPCPWRRQDRRRRGGISAGVGSLRLSGRPWASGRVRPRRHSRPSAGEAEQRGPRSRSGPAARLSALFMALSLLLITAGNSRARRAGGVGCRECRTGHAPRASGRA